MTGEAADSQTPELVDEVALLLREVVYDRVRPDVVPHSLHADPEWLENAAESEYGLLAERLDDYKLHPPALPRRAVAVLRAAVSVISPTRGPWSGPRVSSLSANMSAYDAQYPVEVLAAV